MEKKKLGRTGIEIPAIGMGTWNIAPPDPYAPAKIDEQAIVNALRKGIELGLSHIDSAAMYGNGTAERLVGMAIKGVRDRVFLATKVEPEDYPYQRVLRAARDSLKRLGTDYIDLYQVHWPSDAVPFSETLGAMERLVDEGLVRFIGVSNFSVGQLIEAKSALSRYPVAANQVKYNLLDREIEEELLAYAEREGITITAYSPFDVGRLFSYSGPGAKVINELARLYRRTFAQVCLNWIISKPNVITIPKAVQISHLEENAGAHSWRMSPEDYAALDRVFAVNPAAA